MTKTLIFFATGAALVIACNHETVPSAVTTTGAPGVVPNERAIQQLTAARCDRQQKCGKFGPNEKYADEKACRSDKHQDFEEVLKPTECPGGIREFRLSSCLQELRNERCGDVADKIGRLATCRSGSLCID